MMSRTPSSRCSSAIGLPGTYGESSRTACSASSPGWGSAAMQLEHRPWIGTQHAKQRSPALQRRERLAYPRLLRMALDVDEEHIVPLAPARRPRFDARHADAVARQWLEQPVQRSGRARIADRYQQRAAVRAARAQERAPQDQEARGVIGAILDVTHQQVQPVDLGGGL